MLRVNRRQAMLGVCLGPMALGVRADNAASELIYVGTRGAVASEPPQNNVTHGIYAVRLDAQSGRLSALGPRIVLERATWLETHPSLPILYAAAGSSHGAEVRSYWLNRVTGKLTEYSAVGSGGVGATQLQLDSTSATMFVAHFGSADVTALPLQPDGTLLKAASTQKQFGTGPHRLQNAPHAHGVAISPSCRHVLATDFGADRIFIYRFDRATRSLSPAQTPFEPVPPGSGPSHLLFGQKGKFLYVTAELSAELRVYRWDERKEHLELVQSISAYPAGYPGEQKSSGEIAMSHDGQFIYLSLRGDQDSIIAYAVSKRSGMLQEIQRISANGKAPCSFAIDRSGRWMLVANEASNSVNLLGVDPGTGMLRSTNETLAIPKPVTVAFINPAR